jgi:hypothetical protein
MAVRVDSWSGVMDLEYLRHFVPEGGAAIKFAIGDDDALANVSTRIAGVAINQGYRVAHVDSAATKVHLIQDFFFALSREIDWMELAQSRIEALFEEHGYKWPNPGRVATLSEIASANEVAETLVIPEVTRWLTKGIIRNRDLTQDFTEAMTHLCRSRMEPDGAAMATPILEWLRGELRLLSALRPLPIGAKISRHNGRAMLRSLCHWLALCKCPGILVILDIGWLASRTPSLSGLRYTPASVLDVFEVLRQLIDDTEMLPGFFAIVTAGPSLLDGDDPRRTLDKYPALKARIGLDVRAEQHDNPVAPMVVLSEESGGPGVTTGGTMPFSAERIAVEALRAGVPNTTAIRLLSGEGDAWSDRFVEQLRTIAKAGGDPPIIEGQIVFGGFGTGKSHLLGYLAENAQNQNFIVSPVSISKETPLFNLERVFATAMRNAIVPGINDSAMSVAIGRLDGRSPEYKNLEEWASSVTSGLSPIFPALLQILSQQMLGAEDRLSIARFLSGSRLASSKINAWLRASGARKLFDIRSVKAPDLALQRLRFAPALFRAAGFSGWCVLLDEAELIGRYSALQRGKSYSELARWLGRDRLTAIPGLISVATFVDDFNGVVLDGRLDEEKVPAILEAKGLAEPLRLAQIGMAALRQNPYILKGPDTARLERDLQTVRKLYERSYGSTPTNSGIGEQRGTKTMREHIKSWITDWDIHRFYGIRDTIINEPIVPDPLTENPDLETSAPEPADDAV